MAENAKSTDTTIPTAFRCPKTRRLQLELISKQVGHPHLSATINDAVDRYVESYLRGELAA
jgi:hypothetical protein